MNVDAHYVSFAYYGIPLGMKTGIWRVMARPDGTFLGEVRWFGRWRKYCFFPRENTLFEEICLRDIANFIESITRDRRSSARKRKSKRNVDRIRCPSHEGPLVTK